MTAPLNGSWFWCIKHQRVEFIDRKDDVTHLLTETHRCVGPYPTAELAEEFGQLLWGIKEES